LTFWQNIECGNGLLRPALGFGVGLVGYRVVAKLLDNLGKTLV
jgi:hypothetical protein